MRLQADSTRIKQALINVLGNDIKYNREQGSVRFSCENFFEDWVRISIADTGFGIPEEKYADIFEPFERSHIDKVNVGGVGIGLSISKDLVELMGGTIWFDIVNGEGSVFHIDLPVSNKMSFPDMSDEETRTHSSIKTDEREGKYKILYIEDVGANVALVRQIFARRKDVEILFAVNAEDGIKVAQVEFQDLILLDMHFPDMDGMEAFKKLQTMDKIKSIPVIALTADARDVKVNKALDMGFRDFITKPISVPEFFKIRDSYLK